VKRHFIFFIFLSFLFILNWETSQAQETRPPKAIQLSGLIVTGDSLMAVPFATVFHKRSLRGSVSDFRGFFSFVAREGDTIRFSSIGYKDVYYRIPDTLSANRYSIIQLMTQDTIHLAETIIYPWPTREQFKIAFLNTQIPDDDYDRAIKNLARAEMKERFAQMGMDGSQNFKNYMQQYNNKLYYQGQSPPIPIFNAFAWAKFIQAWREGKFKRTD
jgi:hypothetical protein